MAASSPLSDVAHVIQLAVAPAFLLVAIGSFINILSHRLARIVDRARVLEERAVPDTKPAKADQVGVLRRRRKLVNIAITFGTLAALLVSISIVCAFVGSIVGFDFSRVVAGLFIVAMLAFIGLLVAFLAEIRLALRFIFDSK